MRKTKFVDCPRCEGDGEEPGVPVSWGYVPCDLCLGDGEVTEEMADQYEEDMEG